MLKPPSIKIKFAIVKINIEIKAPKEESLVTLTVKTQVVIDKIVEYYSSYNSNIHRGVHLLSQKASDEYELVKNFQKTIKKQKLLNGTTDVLYLKKSKNKELNFLKKVYFNIELPLLKVSEQ